MPGHLLAIDAGTVSEPMNGLETTEPAFGLPALWIDESQRHEAERRGYTTVDASSVVATYLTELIKRHADELLTRQEVHRLLDNLKEKAPKLVEEVVPKVLGTGEVQRTLQALLRERVPIRDLETILETIGDWAARTKDTEILAEYARNALARTICRMNTAEDGKVHCITFDPSLEALINKGLERTDRGTILALPTQLQSRIVEAIRAQVETASASAGGRSPVILCSPQIRAMVRRMIETALPAVAVMSFNEIAQGVEVQSHAMVVLKDES